MGKGNTRTENAAPLKGRPALVQTVPLDFVLAITDPGGANAFATKPVFKIPKGNWLLLSALANVIIQDVGGTGLIAAFGGTYSFGTTATADATLTGTDRDIVGAAAAGIAFTASGGITPKTKGAISPGTLAEASLNAQLFDNSAGSLNANFNLVVLDASISANASVRVRGQLHLVHAVLGDG